MKILVAVKGGAGSGNWGHSGRPGLIGGSGGTGAPSGDRWTQEPERTHLTVAGGWGSTEEPLDAHEITVSLGSGFAGTRSGIENMVPMGTVLYMDTTVQKRDPNTGRNLPCTSRRTYQVQEYVRTNEGHTAALRAVSSLLSDTKLSDVARECRNPRSGTSVAVYIRKPEFVD